MTTLKEYKAAHYQKNKEEYKRRARENYHNNIEREREARKIYGNNHKEERKLRCLKWRGRRKDWLNEIKSTLHCLHCGMTKIECLDFHHRDPKEKEKPIARMLWTNSKERILKEIAKCDVLCANCHRTYHWEELNNQLSQWRFQSFDLPPPKSGGTFL